MSIYTSEGKFSDFHSWVFFWEEEKGRLWINSSDIGNWVHTYKHGKVDKKWLYENPDLYEPSIITKYMAR